MSCVFLRHSVKSSYEKASLPWMAPLAFHNTGRCLQEESVPWNSCHSGQLEKMWSGDASGFGKMPKVQANCWTHKQRNHRTGRFIYSYVKPSAQVQKSELNLTDNYLVSAPTHSTKRNLPPLLHAIGSIVKFRLIIVWRRETEVQLLTRKSLPLADF